MRASFAADTLGAEKFYSGQALLWTSFAVDKLCRGQALSWTSFAVDKLNCGQALLRTRTIFDAEIFEADTL